MIFPNKISISNCINLELVCNSFCVFSIAEYPRGPLNNTADIRSGARLIPNGRYRYNLPKIIVIAFVSIQYDSIQFSIKYRIYISDFIPLRLWPCIVTSFPLQWHLFLFSTAFFFVNFKSLIYIKILSHNCSLLIVFLLLWF